MIFNEVVIGGHPAGDGYRVECFVRGSEDTQFPSGSGSFKVEFPKFAITGLEFEGANLLTEPADSMTDVIILEKNINLKAYFSGDLNTIDDGLAIKNIKRADVYSGFDKNFSTDIIDHSNRVTSFPLQLTAGEESFQINVTSDDITGRVNETIFYKVIPTDYLTFGEASASVGGSMSNGLSSSPTISSSDPNPFLISRSTANDLVVGQSDLVTEVFVGVDIVVDNTVPLDFYADFIIRTDSEVKLIPSGGAVFTTAEPVDLPIADDGSITIGANSLDQEFTIESQTNGAGTVRTNYLIS